MRAARGAALLLVLWLLLLLAGLVAVFALSARTEAIQGSALRGQVVGRQAAEAGIELAALAMAKADPLARWVPDGREQVLDFEGYRLQVRVQDEAGKVDLNVAPAELLAALMVAVGEDPDRAAALAGAIQDFRDPDDLLAPVGGAEDRDYAVAGLPHGAKDAPFVVLSELLQVRGMDLASYRRVAPYLTVATAQPRPVPAYAQGPVLRAMGYSEAEAAQLLAERAAWRPGLPAPRLPGGGGLAGTGSGTYSISSRATRGDGAAIEVTATLRIGAGGLFGEIYAPLAWRVGEPD